MTFMVSNFRLCLHGRGKKIDVKKLEVVLLMENLEPFPYDCHFGVCDSLYAAQFAVVIGW